MFPRKVEKPWGYELIYAETEKYAGKILFVAKGHQLSLQYHKVKDETIHIYRGIAELEVRRAGGKSQVIRMSAGKSHRISPWLYASRYRARGLRDSGGINTRVRRCYKARRQVWQSIVV